MPWWGWLLLGFALAWLPSLAIVVVLLRRAPYCAEELGRPSQSTDPRGAITNPPPFIRPRTERLASIRPDLVVDERPEILN